MTSRKTAFPIQVRSCVSTKRATKGTRTQMLRIQERRVLLITETVFYAEIVRIRRWAQKGAITSSPFQYYATKSNYFRVATNGTVKTMDTNGNKRSLRCRKIRPIRRMNWTNYLLIALYVRTANSNTMFRVPVSKASEISSSG